MHLIKDNPYTLGAAFFAKYLPAHFILNPGYVQYKLDVLMA